MSVSETGNGNLQSGVIYRHYDRQGRLLYVGATGDDGHDRQEIHARVARWWLFVTRINRERLPGQVGIGAAEAAAIRAERPIFNRRHNGADQPDREAQYLAERAAERHNAPAPEGADLQAWRAYRDALDRTHRAAGSPTAGEIVSRALEDGARLDGPSVARVLAGHVGSRYMMIRVVHALDGHAAEVLPLWEAARLEWLTRKRLVLEGRRPPAGGWPQAMRQVRT